MKQIKNGFKDYYYLTEEGIIYNSLKEKYIKPNCNAFILQTEDDKTRKISLKKLYYLVYNKNYCIDNIKDLDNEVWKDIELTNGIYKISNYGRVKSFVGYEARILKPTRNLQGYFRVDIVQEKQRATKLVHRLVAAAFLLQPHNIDMQIHHKDFDNTNNKADNLQWLTPKEHKEIHLKRNKEIIENGKC